MRLSITTPTTLGNIREVVRGDGEMCQVLDYYPFGTPLCDLCSAINPDYQPFKYNGKEFDMMHGLNTYDYGARLYYSMIPAWDRMDPLCEKYYSVSPYAYCHDNPVNAVDPDGREVREGTGPFSKENAQLKLLAINLARQDDPNSIITPVDRWEKIYPDNIYMIITRDDRMIKHLVTDENDDEILWCISPNYPKFKIEKSEILQLYRMVFHGRFA